MKALKIVGIVLGVLIAILLIMGAIAPKKMMVERSMAMNAPIDLVFNTVNDLSTWESWSPWKEMDATMKVVMGETSTGNGASYTWTAEEAGNGKMTITSSTPTTAIETKVDFEGMGSSDGMFKFEELEKGTNVTWGFEGSVPFPMNAFLLFQDAEGAIGKDFDRGLELLKAYVEAKAEEGANATFDIEQIDLPERFYVGIRATIPMDEITDQYATNFPKIFEALGGYGIEMAGMPSGLYYTWDEAKQETDMITAIPTTKKVEVDAYTTVELPAGKGLLINYYGPYENLGAAHIAMDEYIKENNLTFSPPAIEEYVTDPQSEPDPNKWLTKVVYHLN
ncbi:MAG: hypothetical protein DHS20C18_11750 [Saprospiraceae bacterium]|nr:MAG: hypothetical protein DHS20C18_11750 [Saprospiraceae bacterium]